MEKIYRIASVLIMAAAMFLLSFLLLPLYVAAARLGISPWFVQLSTGCGTVAGRVPADQSRPCLSLADAD